MSDVTLYSYHKSSCAWRVRIALNLKKIAYKYEAIALEAGATGGQFTPAFKSLNPSCQVPVLLIDGESMHESVAISEYLQETRPTPTLYPGDASTRVKIRQIVELINSGIQPKQNLATTTVLVNDFTHDKGSRVKWAAYWNTKGLTILEEMLSKTAGKYCVGDHISFADCCLVPQVYSAFRYEVDVKQFPIVWRLFSDLIQMEEVAAAHEHQQPDAH